MKNYFILILLLVIAVSSCHKKNSLISFKENINATLILMENSPIIFTPIEMLKYRNYLCISDNKGDSLLCVYNLINKSSRRVLPKKTNQDDMEFQSPIQIKIIDTIFFINNRWHNSAGRYSVNLINGEFNLIGNKISINEDIDMLCPINDTTFIASGRFAQGRYSILDKNGNTIRFFGDYPNFQAREDTIPNFPKFMFHQTIFKLHPANMIMASITGHSLDIINIKDPNNPIIIKRLLFSPYKYQYKTGDGWASAKAIDNTEIGMIDVSSSSKYIYVLYSHNTSQKKTKKKLNEIWIFDWNGIPLKKIIPNKEIIKICCDEQDNNIYCTINEYSHQLAYINIQ